MKRFPFRAGIARLFPAALIGAMLASPALADRPWKDAPAPARLLSDSAVPGVKLSALLPHGQGEWLALGADGRPVLIGEKRAAPSVTPFPSDTAARSALPPLVALARPRGAAGPEVWALTEGALTEGNEPALLRLDADGKSLETVPLHDAAVPGSRLTALEVHGGTAFLADEGKPAIVAASLKDGKARRLLGFDASLTGRRPLTRGGRVVTGADGLPVSGGDVRFLALDEAGQWLFYQTAAGPLYRIDASLLTDPDFTPAMQIDGITEWRDTPSLGGLTLAPDGTFYLADIAEGELLKFGPERLPLILWRDPRLDEAGALTANGRGEADVLADEGGVPHLLRLALP